MVPPIEFKLKIEAYRPETIPAERLAQYMLDFAILLGETHNVTFARIDPGSTVPVFLVPFESEPKVRKRVHAARNNEGPDEARRAKCNIDRMLRDDNATGEILSGDRRLLYFPGRKLVQRDFGPFTQPGTVDGVPIVLGGESDPVPVHLQDRGGLVHNCRASRDLVREIAPYIFKAPIRATGQGRWFRSGEGTWEMRQFLIHSFVVLRDESVRDAVERVQAIDAAWKKTPGAIKAIKAFGRGER